MHEDITVHHDFAEPTTRDEGYVAFESQGRRCVVPFAIHTNMGLDDEALVGLAKPLADDAWVRHAESTEGL